MLHPSIDRATYNLRSKLIHRMVRIYGLEHPAVIEFVKICERWPKDRDHLIEAIVEANEEYPSI